MKSYLNNNNNNVKTIEENTWPATSGLYTHTYAHIHTHINTYTCPDPHVPINHNKKEMSRKKEKQWGERKGKMS